MPYLSLDSVEDVKTVLKHFSYSTCIQVQALSNHWQIFSLQIVLVDVVTVLHLSVPVMSITELARGIV